MDLDFIQQEGGLEHVKDISKGLKANRRSFLDSLKQKEPLLGALISSMLEFNPYLRKSAAELMDHPYFDDIRIKQNELSCNSKLLLEIDRDESFDPKSSLFTLSDDELRHAVSKIMLKWDKNHKR